MTMRGKFTVTVLLEHEVRVAAKAFANFHKVINNESSTKEERSDALTRALNAGAAAFAGAEDDDQCVVLSAVPQHLIVLKDRT
jgi:hypothetical protein